MTSQLKIRVVAIAAAALTAASVLAQTAPETFTAMAAAKKGDVSVSSPITLTVTRFASDPERDLVMKAIREGGTAALQKTISKMGDAGYIEIGGQRTPIKYAGQRTTTSGRLVTLVTAQPILHLGAGLPGAKAKTGFDVAVALLDVKNAGASVGEFAPAATVGLDEGGALLIKDYGPTVIWLNGLTRSK